METPIYELVDQMLNPKTVGFHYMSFVVLVAGLAVFVYLTMFPPNPPTATA